MVNNEDMPRHIAIIMDGNRRWAKKRFLPASAGHRAGAKALENLVDEANLLGLKFLTVYAFSTENWKREAEEIKGLMSMLRDYFDKNFGIKDEQNIKITVIGDRTLLDQDIIEKISRIEDKTKDNTGLNFIIALSYGGRDEIIRATKKLVTQVIKTNMDIAMIDEAYFIRYLDTYKVPDPDLLIRTGGEQRLSNFLLWQLSYTEMFFTDTLWPDYNIDELTTAISEYNNRTKRFGG